MRLKHEKMEECQQYFRARPVFQKVFEKFQEKYESLSRMGGTIRLSGLNDEEKIQLGGFFQKDYIGKKTVCISYQAVEKALADSRFAGIDFKELLEEYFKERLIGNRERKESEEKDRQIFFDHLKQRSITSEEIDWITECVEQKNGVYRYLVSLFHENMDACQGMMEKVFYAGAQLPVFHGRLEVLAVFAAKTAGNPHFFDEGTPGNQMLCAYLKYYFHGKILLQGSKTEQKSALLYEAGILKDELWNFVPVYGLHGRKQDGTGHRGLEGFFKEREPVQMTLQMLGNLKELWTENPVIYMVENPAVFSYLCKTYPSETFLCGNGQLRLAVWVLMEKFTGVQTLMYAGDFDPEGLLIAQKLRQRYPGRVQYWNYSGELYRKYLSDKAISETSRKKLNRVTDPGLQEVKRAMMETGRAAYQEAMLEEYGKTVTKL